MALRKHYRQSPGGVYQVFIPVEGRPTSATPGSAPRLAAPGDTHTESGLHKATLNNVHWPVPPTEITRSPNAKEICSSTPVSDRAHRCAPKSDSACRRLPDYRASLSVA